MSARLCLAVVLVASSVAAATPRLRYTVRFAEVRGGASKVVYKALIEGPAATDFEIDLRDARVQIKAQFVNELTSGAIDMRVRIESRRRYGTSPAKLPLWEEDAQDKRFRVGFAEEVELLPFGGAGRDGLLRVTVAPEVIAPSNAPLSIRIDNREPANAITVRAYHVPHWYEVEATLRSQKVIARVFANEPASISVGDTRVVVTASPVPFGDAARTTQLTFDVARGKTSLATGWGGVTSGTPLRYTLRDGAAFQINARPLP